MSDRDFATSYLQASRFDTTRDLLALHARLKGRKLPLAGRLVRDGLRSILASRKAA
jgi:hypothetical protein